MASGIGGPRFLPSRPVAPPGKLSEEADLTRMRGRDVQTRAGQSGGKRAPLAPAGATPAEPSVQLDLVDLAPGDGEDREESERRRGRPFARPSVPVPAPEEEPEVADAYLPSTAAPKPLERQGPDVRGEVRKMMATLDPGLIAFCAEAGIRLKVRARFAETVYDPETRTVCVPEHAFVTGDLLRAFARAFDHALGGAEGFASSRSLAVTAHLAARGAEESAEDYFVRSVVGYLRDAEQLRTEDPGMAGYLDHLLARHREEGRA